MPSPPQTDAPDGPPARAKSKKCAAISKRRASLGDRGLRFNTLSPGPVDTPIMDGQADSADEAIAIKAQFAAAVPLNRMGRPDEIAAAALFLASDDSSFVAGAELSVDGGMAQV